MTKLDAKLTQIEQPPPQKEITRRLLARARLIRLGRAYGVTACLRQR